MTSILATLAQAENDAQAPVSAAVTEHRDAQRFLAALEERVRAADPGVNASEIGEARDLVHHAALRVDAARRTAEQAIVDARHAVYQAVTGSLRAFSDEEEHATMADEFATALAALVNLWQAVDTRSRRLTALTTDAATVVDLAKKHGESAGIRQAGLTWALFRNDDGTSRRIEDVRPHEAAAAVLARLLYDVEAEMRQDPANWHGNHFAGAPWSDSFHGVALTEALRSVGALHAVETLPGLTAGLPPQASMRGGRPTDRAA